MSENNTTTTSSDAPQTHDEKLFPDISPEERPTEIQSYCVNCEGQGTTRLLLTKIPFFREIIIMAFSCPHCSFRNTEVQFGGSIEEKGKRIELKVTKKEDINRQVVKSDSAAILIPEIMFEIPPSTKRGSLNTIEGFLTQAATELKALQDQRRAADPDVAAKIDSVIAKLEEFATGSTKFTFAVDDPAGNSFIENPRAPLPDENMKEQTYERTHAQNVALGLAAPDEQSEEDHPVEAPHQENEVMTFPAICSMCGAHAETRMIVTDIPYFKETILMAFSCDKCGFKSNEVKSGGAVSPKGRKITLKVLTTEDLSRDVLKSETAAVEIPELQLKLTHGTLGGKFTTIEGLLNNICDDLKRNPFFIGDSALSTNKAAFDEWIKRLEALPNTLPFTLIIDDPMCNSYIQNPNAPDTDPQLEIEDYERTHEQNEELGLNDIKTENYT